MPMDATEQQREAVRESLGLGGSTVSRLSAYLLLTLQGEFGRSYKLDQPVLDIVAPYFWGTMKLIGLALPVGVAGGIFLGFFGLLAGVRTDKWLYKLLLVLHSSAGLCSCDIGD
ncbi:hypothetical protein LJK88_33565 [Paenibacillus sp. P26]|nr:hypothetical protein LJK88_33565 [Paenibacillus sp. P26]